MKLEKDKYFEVKIEIKNFFYQNKKVIEVV